MVVTLDMAVNIHTLVGIVEGRGFGCAGDESHGTRIRCVLGRVTLRKTSVVVMIEMRVNIHDLGENHP